MLKSKGVRRQPCGGGPCDLSVSPSPFCLDFGTLDLGFGLGLGSNLTLSTVAEVWSQKEGPGT